VYIFGTKVLDRDYTSLDVPLKKLVPISNYGFVPEFYGGMVTHIGEIKDSKVILLIDNETDGLQIIDTAIEDINDLNMEVLKQIAKTKAIEFDWRKTTKDELVEKLKDKLLHVA